MHLPEDGPRYLVLKEEQDVAHHRALVIVSPRVFDDHAPLVLIFYEEMEHVAPIIQQRHSAGVEREITVHHGRNNIGVPVPALVAPPQLIHQLIQ